ncbi:lipase [Rubrivirga sp. S365]|uniref:esterase/lipase family protein n=1 Tax=Rubrivirga sp. S365 TaxID=3076080 RepID=UPI0028C9BE44|nr:lipase [Rubrivirga sp. S365]MDT7857753.1 lipase [Rubrivirga sp. S365]
MARTQPVAAPLPLDTSHPAPLLSRLGRRAEAVARRAVELEPMPQPPLAPTRYPVVLMHGFGALANLVQGGVLHAEAMHLRGRGVAAYAPHVNPYDTVAVRAAAWADRLSRVRAETGAERLNLVAFSSGGLDARWLARDPAWAGRFASLVTLSTPHRGTALAQYVLDRPDRLRAWAVGFMDFVGRAAYDAAPPHTEAALAELTPDAVAAQFDPDETVDGAWCASFAGRAGRGTAVPVSPPLVVPNRILYGLAGVNDGIVPEASAAWGERLGTVEADHARQIGLGIGAAGHDACAFFDRLCDRLRERGL